MTTAEILQTLENSDIDCGGYVSLSVSEDDADQAINIIEENGGEVIDANPHEAGATITFEL